MDSAWDFGRDPPIFWPAWFEGPLVRINEDVRKSVVFVGIATASGDFSPYGTAFLIAWQDEDQKFPFLVTARHVLEDAKQTGLPICIRVSAHDGTPQLGAMAYEHWHFHPNIAQCDIAVVPVNISHETFDIKYIGINPGELTDKYIAENDVGPGDEVFATGLLTRHFGKSKNIPVVRTGNIAAMPEEPVDLGDMGEQHVYLIESRSIGGLSGSPVFLNTPPFRVVGTNVKDTVGHDRDYLIGVNIGLFKTSAGADSAISEKAGNRDEFLELMSSGIAVVVPIQRVIETIRAHPIAEAMKRTIEKKKKQSDFVPTSAASAVGGLVAEATDNPSHKEDFTFLLGAAAKANKPAS